MQSNTNLKMNTFIHNLEDNFSKLIIQKQTDTKSNKSELINNSLLLPINTDKITSLNLSNCNLSELPDWFSFKNLIDLNISCNQFKNVPHLIYANTKIQNLNICDNKISNFDIKPKCNSSLLYLDLSNNDLENIPPWICNIDCAHLELLKLSNNPLIYNCMLSGKYLKKLKHLELNNSNIRLNDSKNRFFIEIPKLEQLFLNNIAKQNINFMKELNFENYAFVSFLKELHLTGLGISTIPENLIIFENLEILNLNKNYISWFPENFTRLINLKTLIVSENELISIPSDIDKLKHLEQLFISNNSVGVLPSSIKQLKHLQTLDCYNNDFTENIIEKLKNISSITSLDYEQNPFEVAEDETYLKKRNKLRTDNCFINRINGSKIYDLSETDTEYDTESDTDSEKSFYEYIEENEAENWDQESINSISDDMELMLPKFRYPDTIVTKNKHPIDFMDPICFEDADNCS